MIGLISAMEEELSLFIKNTNIVQEVTQSGIKFYLGELAGHKVILLKSGVGKVNAAVATQILIDRFGVNAVIFTGLAGTLVPYLKRGDLVVSNFVVQHDIDLTAFGRRPGEIPELTRLIEANPELVRCAADAFEKISIEEEWNNQVVVGTIATGDTFVAEPERIKWLQREFGAVATEMEGGAVGQVCMMNRIPFLVIRIISDGAGDGAAAEFITFLEDASAVTFRVTRTLLESIDHKLKPVAPML